MSDWLMKTIRAEAKHLLELATDDFELRADLRALAEEILAATEAPLPSVSPSSPGTDLCHQEQPRARRPPALRCGPANRRSMHARRATRKPNHCEN